LQREHVSAPHRPPLQFPQTGAARHSGWIETVADDLLGERKLAPSYVGGHNSCRQTRKLQSTF